MRIDLDHDRVDHHPSSYRDPVVAREGAFAELDDCDLSEAEAKRIALAKDRDAKGEAPSGKTWTPRSILNRITKLYAGFTKPQNRNAATARETR